MPHHTLSDTSCTLIARALPDAKLIGDPRAFAWEILRRRADYSPVPIITERIGSDNAPIELIRPQGQAADWGLRFRRSGGPGRRKRPAVLERRS